MKKTTITQISTDIKTIKNKNYPLFLSPVSAGFPSPADDYLEKNIDLHKLLVTNPPATFFVRVDGDSMTGAGIFSGDILVIDRSIQPKHNNIIIAVLDGELTVKRLHKTKEKTVLKAENPNYPDIKITKEDELTIWGVATNTIHKL